MVCGHTSGLCAGGAGLATQALLVQRAPPSLHRGLCGAPSELAAPWLADVCPGERLRDSDPQHPDLKTGRIAPSSENG